MILSYIKLYQIDVKSAFFISKVNELEYVEQPPGFKDTKRPNRMYKLKEGIV